MRNFKINKYSFLDTSLSDEEQSNLLEQDDIDAVESDKITPSQVEAAKRFVSRYHAFQDSLDQSPIDEQLDIAAELLNNFFIKKFGTKPNDKKDTDRNEKKIPHFLYRILMGQGTGDDERPPVPADKLPRIERDVAETISFLDQLGGGPNNKPGDPELLPLKEELIKYKTDIGYYTLMSYGYKLILRYSDEMALPVSIRVRTFYTPDMAVSYNKEGRPANMKYFGDVIDSALSDLMRKYKEQDEVKYRTYQTFKEKFVVPISPLSTKDIRKFIIDSPELKDKYLAIQDGKLKEFLISKIKDDFDDLLLKGKNPRTDLKHKVRFLTSKIPEFFEKNYRFIPKKS